MSPTSDAHARRVLLLGCTGSIGTQTLEVVAHLNGLHARGELGASYRVVGLAARRDSEALRERARALEIGDIAVAEGDAPWARRPRRGPDAAERLVREVPADVVVCAMVGIAGLPATLAAVELGREVALANKETLVAGGAVVTSAAAHSGAGILPIDSEHSALWQCLLGGAALPSGHPGAPPRRLPPSVRRCIITASGGPFRARAAADVYHATPREALNHPTWSMGRKVTIDSATLMNKALELVEAHWLFGLEPDRLGVLVHPQSIVHAIVEMADGQALAQMAAPDMRAPIQTALTHPLRAPGAARRLDWAALSRLDFAEPDPERFPALRLGFEAIRRGGTFGAAMNAANEVAVEAFLAERLSFGRITGVVEAAAERTASAGEPTLPEIMAADAAARAEARGMIGG